MAIDGDVMYFHSGGRVVIADISNPADPVELGSLSFRDMVYCLRVRGNYLYVGGGPYTTCFRIYDISNPAAPVEVYQWCGGMHGVSDIALYGDVAYTLDGVDANSWDISDPQNPVRHNNFYGAMGGPMAVSGDYLFMANDRAKLIVFDLAGAANPLSPPIVAEVPLPGSWWAGAISVEGDYACIVNMGSEGNLLVVVDISTPSAPVVLGSVDEFVQPRDVALSGGIAYVADWGASSPPLHSLAKGLAMFDVAANPASPALLGTFQPKGDVFGLTVVGSTVYLHDEGEGVIVVDASDPANAVRLGNVHSPRWLTKEDLAGDLLYASDRWNGFTILDVSDPLYVPMHPIGVYQSTATDNWGIDVQAGLAYLGAGTGGLEIVDVSDPSAPVMVGQYPAPTWVTGFDDLEVHDGIAYVGASVKGGGCATYVLTLDVSDPAAIVFLDSLQIGFRCRVREIEVYVEGSTVLVHAINEEGETWIIDASDPGNLELLSSPDPDDAMGLALSETGDLRYVANYGPTAQGLFIHDVRDPVNPIQLSHTPFSCYATSVDVSGNLACLVACNLHVLDVSDPSAPVTIAQGGTHRLVPDLSILLTGPLMYGVKRSGGVILDLIARPGDFDGDLSVTLADLPGFVACLLDPAPATCLIADMNDDGNPDGADIPLFVAAILNN